MENNPVSAGGNDQGSVRILIFPLKKKKEKTEKRLRVIKTEVSEGL